MLVRDRHGRVQEVEPGKDLTIAQAVYLSGGFATVALCSGIARCGRCRVRFVEASPAADETEIAVLGDEAVADGWRLGCRRKAESGLVLEVPVAAHEQPATSEAPSATGVVMGVDLGTTSIAWSAHRNGTPLASGGMLNPQLGAGSEVMSRLAFARDPERAARLRSLVLSALESAAAQSGPRPEAMCVSANQAMTCLLLGLPVSSLSAAPYGLCHAGGEWVSLSPGLPKAYIMPQISAFVGGDAVAGIVALALGHNPPGLPYLLVDMGTNGEFVLALEDGSHLAASVPLGPALEGVAMACGMVFGQGAVTGFDMGPKGLLPQGEAQSPAGITGTGYVSLLARLLAAGLLDVHGRFTPCGTPLAGRLAKDLELGSGEALLKLPGGLHLTAGDVEEVLKVKAAFNVAFARLLSEAGLKPGDLGAVLVAGSLGEHVSPADLERLGFLPPGMAGRTRAVGNTSLAGAQLCAQSQAARDFAVRVAHTTRVIDLMDAEDFGKSFMHGMRFSYES